MAWKITSPKRKPYANAKDACLVRVGPEAVRLSSRAAAPLGLIVRVLRDDKTGAYKIETCRKTASGAQRFGGDYLRCPDLATALPYRQRILCTVNTSSIEIHPPFTGEPLLLHGRALARPKTQDH